MLLLVIGIILLVCVLLLLGGIHHESSKAEYPPGIANPTELRRIHIVSSALKVLGKVLERVGVCSEVALFRSMVNLSKPRLKDDSELSTNNLHFEGVPVRLYQAKAPSAGGRKGILFFHGGGFVFGSIESYDGFCRYVSKKTGAVVVSVGYRLAPEHRYPAAFDDCLNATIHFMKTAEQYGVNPSSIVVSGDSAGGNLAAGVSQALVTRTDIPRPLAQALIYPSVQMIDYNLPAYQQNRMVPPLLRERTYFYKMTYLGGDLSMSEQLFNGIHVPPELRKQFLKWLSAANIPDEFKVRGYTPHVTSHFSNLIYQRIKHAFDPACSPLLAEDDVIRQLPKTYILTCEFDVIRDDGILYKKRLEDNAIPVTWYHVKDGFHGIISFFDQPVFESGKRAMDHFVSFLKDA